MENKGKTVSKESDKALEYYKLYSDNDKLPRYFCGSLDDVGASPAQPIPTVRIEEDGSAAEGDEEKAPSPASSVTSNRKLEWDYGADIGYENIGNKSLYKSLSLPALGGGLNVSLGHENSDCKSEKTCREFDEGWDLPNKKIENKSASDENVSTKSNSGDAQQLDTTKKSFCNKDVLKYIKARVGLPVAQSTPFNKLEISKTIGFEIKGDSSSSNDLKKITSSETSSSSVKTNLKPASSDSSANSNLIKVIEIESSSDSQSSTRKLESNSEEGLIFPSEKKLESGDSNAGIKLSSDSNTECKFVSKTHSDLYTPKIAKERRAQNIQTLIVKAGECSELRNENPIQSRRPVLTPTSFYFEIKQPSSGSTLSSGVVGARNLEGNEGAMNFGRNKKGVDLEVDKKKLTNQEAIERLKNIPGLTITENRGEINEEKNKKTKKSLDTSTFEGITLHPTASTFDSRSEEQGNNKNDGLSGFESKSTGNNSSDVRIKFNLDKNKKTAQNNEKSNNSEDYSKLNSSFYIKTKSAEGEENGRFYIKTKNTESEENGSFHIKTKSTEGEEDRSFYIKTKSTEGEEDGSFYIKTKSTAGEENSGFSVKSKSTEEIGKVSRNPEIYSKIDGSFYIKTKENEDSGSFCIKTKSAEEAGKVSRSGSSESVSDGAFKTQLDLTLAQRIKYFNKYRDKKIKNLCVTQCVFVECLDPTSSKDQNIQTSAYLDPIALIKDKSGFETAALTDKENIDSIPLKDKEYLSSIKNKDDLDSMELKDKEYLNLIKGKENLDSMALKDRDDLDLIALKDKNIQTSSENVSVGIQTARGPKKKPHSVVYTLRSENQDYNTNSSTQTNSEAVFSDCDSFEFLNGSECESNKAVSDYHSKKLKRSAVKSDLTNLTSNSSSSKENYLSDLLCQQVSAGIDKKLELLQKLYKSKKYDKETKKYYLRKVLKSILSNHSEGSSVYSEEITPKIAEKRDGILKSFEDICDDLSREGNSDEGYIRILRGEKFKRNPEKREKINEESSIAQENIHKEYSTQRQNIDRETSTQRRNKITLQAKDINGDIKYYNQRLSEDRNEIPHKYKEIGSANNNQFQPEIGRPDQIKKCVKYRSQKITDRNSDAQYQPQRLETDSKYHSQRFEADSEKYQPHRTEADQDNEQYRSRKFEGDHIDKQYKHKQNSDLSKHDQQYFDEYRNDSEQNKKEKYYRSNPGRDQEDNYHKSSKIQDDQVNIDELKKYQTEAPNFHTQYESDSSREMQLKTNVPWVPQVAPQSPRNKDRKSKKSSSDDLKKNDRRQRNRMLTINTSPKSSKRIEEKLKSCLHHKKPSSENIDERINSRENVSNKKEIRPLLFHQRSESSGNADKSSETEPNWKENKTLSEKMLEMRNFKLSSGDSLETPPNDELVFFAKRERENQITWINNEIEHLVKLKGLLEKKKQKKKLGSDKPEQSKKKTTAIYMITSERGEGSGGVEVPIRSSIIRNGDISQTEFVVKNDKGTTAYKVHELQTGPPSLSSSSSGKVGRVQEDLIQPQIVRNKEKRESKVHDSEKCQCRSKTPESENPYPNCDCKQKPTTSAKSTEFQVWKNQNKEPDSNTLEGNSSLRSIRSNGESAKLNFSNAVLISSSVRPSLTNPGDSVRRLVLEIPIDSKEQHAQVLREVNSKEVQTSKSLLLESNVESTSSESSISSSSCSDGSLVLCSCCRKMIAASESSIGLNSELHSNISPPPVFCQPCFIESKKKLVNPEYPYFQQPHHQCNCHNPSANTNFQNPNVNNNNFPNSNGFRNNAFLNPNNNFLNPNRNSNANNNFLNPNCQNQNSNNNNFLNPNANCQNSNNNLDPDPINQIRTTLKELEELEEREKYCRCLNSKLGRLNDDICKMCKCKVSNSKSSKKPVAYLLTFEPGDMESPDVKQKVKSLEEVKVKVPTAAHKSRRKKSEEKVEKSVTEKEDGNSKKHKHSSKHKNKKTLQEYLETNHPSFVKAAEERRKCMIDLAYMREQRCQKYKQLLALTNGIPLQKPAYNDIQQKRIFTSKEMKSMTAKKYKKLPEVQQKLVENRTKQIKKANRLLADIFNKKLRERVLLGKPDISASTSVINLM